MLLFTIDWHILYNYLTLNICFTNWTFVMTTEPLVYAIPSKKLSTKQRNKRRTCETRERKLISLRYHHLRIHIDKSNTLVVLEVLKHGRFVLAIALALFSSQVSLCQCALQGLVVAVLYKYKQ